MFKKLFNISLILLPLLITAEFIPRRVIEPDYKSKNCRFTSIYVSPFGQIYTIDQLNNEVYLLGQTGKIINSTGGFGWEKGLFDNPTNISSPDGLNIYVADYNNQRIALYDKQLNFLSIFPNSNSSQKSFYPLDVAISSFEKIFILDEEDREILCYNQEGKFINRFGGIDYGEYGLISPREMVIRENNEIAVLEENRIVTFSIYGKPLGIVNLPDTLTASSFCSHQNIFTIINNKGLYIYDLAKRKGKQVELQNFKSVEKLSDCFITDKLIYIMNQEGKISTYKFSEIVMFKEDRGFQE